MNSYIVERDDDLYLIRETSTQNVIMRTTNSRLAFDTCASLNADAGFAGNIPNFFLNTIEKQ